jgi:hypothetical protein
MMNRKGDTINHTISVVVAVLCIALIIYGVYKLYTITQNEEERIAKKTLDEFVKKLEALPDGNTAKIVVPQVASKKEDSVWFLTGWSVDDLDVPDKCFFGNCICVCRAALKDDKISAVSNDLTSFHINLGGIEWKLDGEKLAKERKNICQNEGYCKEFKSNYKISFLGENYNKGSNSRMMVPIVELSKLLNEVYLNKRKSDMNFVICAGDSVVREGNIDPCTNLKIDTTVK